MRTFYDPNLTQTTTNAFLNSEDARHAIKVLRLKKGDTIQLIDGKNGLYTASIQEADFRKCLVQIQDYELKSEQRKSKIHLALAPTKNMDRIEWFVEKSVEIGVDKISFVQTQYSERKVLKLERLEKIIISAMKQSLQLSKPEVSPLIPLQDFVKNCEDTQRFIAFTPTLPNQHLFEKVKVDTTGICTLIGPEGGFSLDEVALANQNQFESVSLGKSRLRTETAGVVACQILNMVNNR